MVDVAPSSEGDGPAEGGDDPAEAGVATDIAEQGTAVHALTEWKFRRALR